MNGTRTQTAGRRRGRPTKYSPEVVETILEAIRRGASRRAAAGAAGVNADTLYAWMRRYPDFRDGVMMADAYAAMVAEQLVFKRDPLRWLQVHRPEVWGNLGRQRIELSGPAGAPLELEHVIDTASILAVARWLQEQTGEAG